MVKLESLKKSNQFRKVLKEKKIHTEFFSIFAAKNFFKPKHKANLLISFVMKKKNWKCSKKKQNQKKIKSNCSEIIEKKRCN